MAASIGRLCGPCDTRHATTVAAVWCTSCNEGLCKTCSEHHTASKGTKQHQTIPVSQYIGLESFVTSMKQDCDSHGRKFDFYCNDHNVPCCVSCIPDHHPRCKHVKPIDELSRKARRSDALPDIKKGLKELHKTITEIMSDRQKNLNKIERQRSNIVNEIKDMKLRIISYLDRLESDVLKELDEKYQNKNDEIVILLEELKEKEGNIQVLITTIQQLNRLPDIQVFLASKELETKLNKEEKWATDICSTDKGMETNIKFRVEQQLERFMSEIKTLGKIEVSHNPVEITAGAWKHRQAQIHIPTGISRQLEDINLHIPTGTSHRLEDTNLHIPTGTSHQFEDINLQLELHITIEGLVNICGCCSLPDGQMIFADHESDKLLVYKKDGKFNKAISIDCAPDGLTVIDSNSVAVSCSNEEMVQIINIPRGVVKKIIKVSGQCHGISYNMGKLYVLVHHRGIEEYDIRGKFIKTIPVDVPTEDGYLCCCSDGFCYTSFSNNTQDAYIAYCDANGKELWKSDIGTTGVTVDNTGNIFVTNFGSSSLYRMSADGKRNKRLLSFDDGLCEPEGVYYNKEKNTLLIVTAYEGKAALYRVV